MCYSKFLLKIKFSRRIISSFDFSTSWKERIYQKRTNFRVIFNLNILFKYANCSKTVHLTSLAFVSKLAYRHYF